MRRVTEYRRFAEECRRLAAVLTKPADKRALELMAKGWDKSADAREAKLRGSNDLSEATLCGSDDLGESTLRGSDDLSEATSEPRQAAAAKRGHYCIYS
jgi:hypothetical protein